MLLFVHVRALIEFLGVRKPKASDFSARDLVPAWTPPTGPIHKTLDDHWLHASQQVMHFSKQRAKQDDGTVVDTDVSRDA